MLHTSGILVAYRWLSPTRHYQYSIPIDKKSSRLIYRGENINYVCIAKRYTGHEQVAQPINKEIQDIQVLQKHHQCKQKEEEKVNEDLKSY